MNNAMSRKEVRKKLNGDNTRLNNYVEIWCEKDGYVVLYNTNWNFFHVFINPFPFLISELASGLRSNFDYYIGMPGVFLDVFDSSRDVKLVYQQPSLPNDEIPKHIKAPISKKLL